MAGRLVSPIIVGRTDELTAIADGLDAARDGQASALLLAGEAGVGKSRLVEEAMRLAADRGMRVLRGACVNIGATGVPYGPIVEALRELHRELPPEEIQALVGHSGADLGRLLPAFAASSPETPEPTVQSQWLQARLLEAILGLVHRLAERSPVLLVVEDLHWADPGTRETLTYLVRNLRSDAIALLITYRSDELHRRHPLLPWLAELERTGRVKRIDVARLDSSRTRELVSAILGGDAEPDLIARVVERSDGNPFFIEELVMAERATTDRGMPPTLRGILLARISTLPEPAQSVVGVAAVAGRRVDHDLLASVAGQAESTTIAALRDAVGQQILVAHSTGGSDGYAFRHALMQEAAYEDLLPGERRRLHRAFAEAVAARGVGTGADAAAHWAELAHHWSATRDDTRALEASIRAATASMESFAFADALRHFETALDLWSSLDDPESVAGLDLASLLDQAANIASLDGQTRRGAALREAAIAELGPGADPVQATLWQERLGRQRWLAADTAGALRAYDEAMAMAAPPSPARARVLSGYGQLLMLVDRWDESRDLCEEALQIARETGDRQVEGHALCTLGLDYSALGRSGEGVAALEEAHRIAVEIGNFDDVGRANVNLANALLYTGQADRGIEIVRNGIAEAERLGIASSYGCYLAHTGVQILNDLGRWDEALELASATFALQHLEPHLDRYGLARFVPLLVSAGYPTAIERLDQLGRLLEGMPPEGQFSVPYHGARAEHLLWNGRPEEALATSLRGLEGADPTTMSWYPIRLVRIGAGAAAEVAESGRAGRDQRLVEAARAAWEAFSDLIKVARAAGAFERLTGEARAQVEAELAMIQAEHRRIEDEPQVDAWRLAVEWLAIDGRPYPLAYARWRLAESLLVDGDRAAASKELRAAHRGTVALGAEPMRRAIENLAARARIDLAPADEAAAAPVVASTAPDDPFGLTPREREVLALVSTGRTNRQIADELFISESTAGVHVSNILGKLGVATRTEAASVAVRLNLDQA